MALIVGRIAYMLLSLFNMYYIIRLFQVNIVLNMVTEEIRRILLNLLHPTHSWKESFLVIKQCLSSNSSVSWFCESEFAKFQDKLPANDK